MRIVSLLILFWVTTSAMAVDVDPLGKEVKSGVRKYKQGDFNGALDSFQKVEKEMPEDPRVSFNKGAGYYKLGDFDTALEHFEKSFQKGDTELKAKSLYNMGNTYYKKGDKKRAIEHYLGALSQNPNLEQAKRNLELVRKKEEKPPQKNSQNSEEPEKQEGDNQSSQAGIDQKNPPSKKDSKSEESEEMQKQMSRKEAERIMESNRQDKIKRKKAKTKWSNYNEVFW